MIQFVAGSNKGGVKQGDVWNDPFKLGDMTEDRINYTGSKVVEPLAGTETKVCWTPVVADSAKFYDETGAEVAGGSVAADGTLVIPAGAKKVAYVYDNVVIPQNDIPALNARVQGIALAAKARKI